MKTVPLAEIASINPRGESVSAESEVSFVGMAELDAVSAAARPLETRTFSEVSKGYTIFRDGDVLAAKITPCWENGKVGQAHLNHSVGVGSTEFHVLRPGPELDDRYLLHFLRQPLVRKAGELRMTGSAGQKRVPPGFLQGLEVPLPPLPDQRRIAAILDHSDALRVRRRQVLARLDALVLSMFDSMFDLGDYPLKPLGSHIADQQIGLDRRGAEQGPERAHDYVKMDAITSDGMLNLASVTRVDASPNEVAKYSLRDGDLLLNTRNSRELVGKTALYRGRSRLYNNNVMRIRFDDALLATYVHRYLWTNDGQSQLEARKSGTTSVFAIYAKSLATLLVPMPPLNLQRAFADRIDAIDTQRERVLRGLALDDELVASLQSRAFRGEL